MTAHVENDVPELLSSVQDLISEYTQISDTFDAEVTVAENEFREKYQICVKTELESLMRSGGEINDFTSQINVLKTEHIKMIRILQAKQNVMSSELKSKLCKIGLPDLSDRLLAITKDFKTCPYRDNVLAHITKLSTLAMEIDSMLK